MEGYVSRGLYGRLVQEVGVQIATGELAPGQRVDVENLQTRHNVSRTVARDAVRVLTTKGMVDARPKRGTFVLEREHWSLLDPDVISWIYGGTPDTGFLETLNEVRQIIEPAGARLAATRHSAANVAAMRGALADLAAAGSDVEAAAAADVRFHHALAVAAGNEILQHLGTVIEAGLRARDMLVLAGNPDADIPFHSAVVDAIEAGDADGAAAAMRTLLDRALELDRPGKRARKPPKRTTRTRGASLKIK